MYEKDYKNLYLKYKVKYNKLKNMTGGEPFKWEIINDRGELEHMNDIESVKIDSLREVNIDHYKFDFINLKVIIPGFSMPGHRVPDLVCDIKLLDDMKTWQFKIPFQDWQNFSEEYNKQINDSCTIEYNGKNYKFYSGKLTIPPRITDKPNVIKLKQTDLKHVPATGAAEELSVREAEDIREAGERRERESLAKIRSDRKFYDKEYYLDFSGTPELPEKFREFNNLRLCVGYGDYIRSAKVSEGVYEEMPNTKAYPDYDVYLIWSEYNTLEPPDIFNIPANIEAIKNSDNQRRIICDVNLGNKEQVKKFTEMFQNRFKSIQNVSNGPPILVEDAVKLLRSRGTVKISRSMHSKIYENYESDRRFVYDGAKDFFVLR